MKVLLALGQERLLSGADRRDTGSQPRTQKHFIASSKTELSWAKHIMASVRNNRKLPVETPKIKNTGIQDFREHEIDNYLPELNMVIMPTPGFENGNSRT